MKKLILVASLLLCTPLAHAQGFICSVGPGQQDYHPTYDASPTTAAQSEMNRVFGLLCAQGCGSVVFVRNTTAQGAAYDSRHRGVPKIIYNPDFMNSIMARFGPASTFAILAHELGHHLDFSFNAGWMDHSWGRELRADAWAGCALARAGLTGSEMDGALMTIAAYPSETHPGWEHRVVAVRTGYANCGGHWRGGYARGPRR